MDCSLRCNSVKCRTRLSDKEVVTTISHIFCLPCSRSLGLSHAVNGGRICPACESRLVNPNDVVVSQLNPSEDYKTSALSGLSPGNIMECASRALAFHSYQIAQEVVYQEFLAKTLKEKYATLNEQMDQAIYDANAEITHLRNIVTAMEAEHRSMQQKNYDLQEAYKEELGSYQRAQTRYDDLRMRLLHNSVQDAAIHAVDQAFQTGDEGLNAKAIVGNAKGDHRHHEHSDGRVSNGGSVGNVPPRHTAINSELGVWQTAGAFGIQTSPSQHRTRLPVATSRIGPLRSGSSPCQGLAQEKVLNQQRGLFTNKQ